MRSKSIEIMKNAHCIIRGDESAVVAALQLQFFFAEQLSKLNEPW